MRLLTWLIWTGLIIQNQYQYGACVAVSTATCANYQLKENKYDGMQIARKAGRLSGVHLDKAYDLTKYWYNISLSKVFKGNKEIVMRKLLSGTLLWSWPFQFYEDWSYEISTTRHSSCIINYSKKWLIVAWSYWTWFWKKGYTTIKWKDVSKMYFSTIHTQ